MARVPVARSGGARRSTVAVPRQRGGTASVPSTTATATESAVQVPTRPVPGVAAMSVHTVFGVHPSGWFEVLGGLLSVSAALAVLALTSAALPLWAAATTAGLWAVGLLLSGHHRTRPVPDTWAEAARRVSRTTASAGLGWWGVTLAAPALGDPVPVAVNAHVAMALLLAAGFHLGGRTLTRAVRGLHRPRLVVAGHPDDVARALVEIAGTGHTAAAVCLSRPDPSDDAPHFGVPVVHGLTRAEQALREHAGEALLVLPGADVDPTNVRRLQWQAAQAGVEVYVASGLTDVAPTRTRAVSAAGMRALHVTHPRLHGPGQLLKTLIDRSAAFVALVLLAPALLLVAVLVRRDSPGPALYRQARIGRDGQPFTMLKFRSMRSDAAAPTDCAELAGLDEADGVLFKIRADPRVTRVGAWLRKYSVDELPQLINVLRGEMSLVGPRPALPGEVAAYDHDPYRRLAVRPGLTGLWQVSGRSDLSWNEAVRLDVRYVDNWSLRLDLWILLRTVRAVLSHRGAY